MKVLQVHCRYRSPSGEEAVVERERTLLVDAGHEVELLEFTNDGGRRSAVDLLLAAHNPLAARALRAAVGSFRPDVVHVHNTWFAASPTVMSAAKGAGVPTVATLHNYRAVCPAATLRRDGERCAECVGGRPLAAIAHRCVNDSLVQSVVGASVVVARSRAEANGALVDRYIAPTAVLADEIARGGVPRDRLAVIPHFVPDPGPPPAGTRDLTLVYAGRLSEEKGIQVAVDAWERMPSRPDGARFVVVGEGPLEDDLRRRAVPGIEFLGRRPNTEVASLLGSSRLAVVPSVWNEPFGLFILEAMAAGVGVVASASGGAPEFLADGAGWIVPAGDASALSDAFADLLSPGADGRVAEAGVAARRRATSVYGPERHLVALEALYDEVASNR